MDDLAFLDVKDGAIVAIAFLICADLLHRLDEIIFQCQRSTTNFLLCGGVVFFLLLRFSAGGATPKKIRLPSKRE
jgi:hypothetical protein